MACFANDYAFARLLSIIFYYNNFYYNYITADTDSVFTKIFP